MIQKSANKSGRWSCQELTYCSNVHPSDTLETLDSVITHFIKGVMNRRNLDSMASGLWLSGQIASELSSSRQKLNHFSKLLSQTGIKLITLNGFPFGNFHAESVKERVYTPDWSTSERYNYTQQLAKILTHCLPANEKEGTISSLPLGYRHSWSQHKHLSSTQALCKLAQCLSELYDKTGKSIRICLEMEPDCVLETTAEMIHFFTHDLPNQAFALGINKNVINNHLGVCFDVCHQAVMFEDVNQSLNHLLSAGIAIGKIQISSALEVKYPSQENSRQALNQFIEPRYLHQSRCLHNGKLFGEIDLPIALESETIPSSAPWRIHFHVPIQATTLENKELNTTQNVIFNVLDFLKNTPHCRPHMEIETYTWQVLPPSLRPQDDEALINGLTEELNWLEKEMSKRELLAENC